MQDADRQHAVRVAAAGQIPPAGKALVPAEMDVADDLLLLPQYPPDPGENRRANSVGCTPRAVAALGHRVDDLVRREGHLEPGIRENRHALFADFLHDGVIVEPDALRLQPRLVLDANPGCAVPVDLLGRVRVHDADALALPGEIHRRLTALELRAEDDEGIAPDAVRERAGRNHAVKAGNIQRAVQTAHRDDHHIGFGLADHAGIHHSARPDGDTPELELTDQIVLVVLNPLVRSLDPAQLVHRRAEPVFLFIQRDAVPALRRNPRGLHAGRSAADDHHVQLFPGFDRVIVLRHVVGEGAGQRGIDTAVQPHAHVVGRGQAGHAARARRDFIQPSLAQFLDVVHVGQQRPRHQDEVDLSVRNRVFDQLRRHARVHRANGADGNADVRLDGRRDLEQRAEALILAGHPAKVLAQVRDGAIAGVAVLRHMQDVRHEARAVVTVRLRADVQAARARPLENACELAGLLQADAQRIVAQIAQVLLDAAHQDLDDEVPAAAAADALDDLRHHAGAVFHRIAAVLIRALVVGESGQIGREIVVAGGIDSDAVIARLPVALRRIDEL